MSHMSKHNHSKRTRPAQPAASLAMPVATQPAVVSPSISKPLVFPAPIPMREWVARQQAEYQQRQHAIPGLLPQGITLLAGKSGSGAVQLALGLGKAFAEGS